MNQEGYNKVLKALGAAGPGRHRGALVEVIPRPDNHEEVRWITIISYGPRLVPGAALHALQKARLMQNKDGSPAQNGPPSFVMRGSQLGAITLEDMTYKE